MKPVHVFPTPGRYYQVVCARGYGTVCLGLQQFVMLHRKLCTSVEEVTLERL